MLVTALISAADMAVISSILLSASASSGCGSTYGLRDKVLGALFRVPFSQVAVNVYRMILVFKHCSRGFLILSNLLLVNIGISVVRYNGEVRQACQEDVTFSDGPRYC